MYENISQVIIHDLYEVAFIYDFYLILKNLNIKIIKIIKIINVDKYFTTGHLNRQVNYIDFRYLEIFFAK